MMAVTGAALKSALASVGLRLITREEWGARPRKYINYIQLPSPYLWIHHTAVESTDDAREVRAHQNFHMDTRGWSDIAYSLLVPDPNPSQIVFEGRGIGVQGGHTAGYNRRSHAICVLGNFQVDRPSQDSLISVAKLIRLGRDKRWWGTHVGGHKDVASTSCPGQHLYAQLGNLRAMAVDLRPAPVPAPRPPAPAPSGGTVSVNVPVLRRGNKGGAVRSLQGLLNVKAGQGLRVDGDFGPATERAVKNVQLFFRLSADGIVGARTWPTLFL